MPFAYTWMTTKVRAVPITRRVDLTRMRYWQKLKGSRHQPRKGDRGIQLLERLCFRTPLTSRNVYRNGVLARSLTRINRFSATTVDQSSGNKMMKLGPKTTEIQNMYQSRGYTSAFSFNWRIPVTATLIESYHHAFKSNCTREIQHFKTPYTFVLRRTIPAKGLKLINGESFLCVPTKTPRTGFHSSKDIFSNLRVLAFVWDIQLREISVLCQWMPTVEASCIQNSRHFNILLSAVPDTCISKVREPSGCTVAWQASITIDEFLMHTDPGRYPGEKNGSSTTLQAIHHRRKDSVYCKATSLDWISRFRI